MCCQAQSVSGVLLIEFLLPSTVAGGMCEKLRAAFSPGAGQIQVSE